MYDRSYGTSGYKPDPEFQRPAARVNPAHAPHPPHPAHTPHSQKPALPWSRRKKLLYGLGFLFVLGFFLLYQFLGDFGFLLFRAPSLTGFPFGSRTYLVLFQNNYELRPTGGFISNYGVLHFSHGVYTGIDFHDVYGDIDNHDYVEPPLVLSTLLQGNGYSGHNFRDANDNPDFRLTKDQLIEFYNMTYPDQEIDGVLAVDFHFLEQFVGMYAPITVEGQTLTQQNLFQTLSSLASDVDRHSTDALAQRKDIATPLMKSLINKTVIFPWRIHSFLTLLSQGFNEKHVLAAFNSSGLADSFHSRNWDGALPQSDMGDFLAVNEGNYGGAKSDRYITRDVTYDLSVGSQRDIVGNPVITANVTVTLTHNGSYNIPLSGDYSGYLRTMIPKSSKILSGGSVTEDRDDVYVLGELVRLKPGESVSYHYTYQLPEYVWNNGTYYLHLHKQPGTDGDYYRVVVHTPQDTSLDAPLFEVRENTASFDAHLTEDMNLAFTLLPDNHAPRIISHEMTDMNQITIVFNEPVNLDSAGDSMNYQVLDLDQTVLGTTDTVAVSSVKVDGAAVILTLSGMTEQEEEFYSVTLQGITDNAGNLVNPSPRTVTVVQRPAEFSSASTEEEAATEEGSTSDEGITEDVSVDSASTEQ
jgi:hypothetical protein